MMNTNMKKALLLAVLAVSAAVALAQAPMPRRLGNLQNGLRRNRGAAAQQQQPAAEATPIADQLKDIPKGTNGVPILNFENAPLELVLMQYATLSEKVLLPAPNLPKVQITLSSNGRELDKESYLLAIEATLTMNGVVIEPFDKHFLRAFERKTVRTQGIRTLMNVSTNGLPEKGRVVSQLIRLNHMTAEEAQKAVEGFKNPDGLFQVFERNNAILVTDTQENVNRMLEIIKELDEPNPVLEETFERQINFAKATDIKTYLETIVTESQKENQKGGAAPKASGGPGFARTTPPPQPTRLLSLNNRPGQNRPEPQARTPNAVLTAAVSDADRGMIRGKVLIVADERSNKLIIITAKTNMDFFDKVIKSLDVETTPEVEVEVIRLKYADAEDVEKMLNDLIGAGSSSSQSKNNQNQNVAKGASTTRNLTQGTSTPARPSTNPTFSSKSNLGDLNKDNVKILADKRINSIVVMARKADMASIKRVVDAMDLKLSQVLIETVIIEVTLGDDLQTGVDWVQRGRQHVFQRVQETDSYGRKLYWNEVTDDNGSTTMQKTTEESANPVYKVVKTLQRDGFFNNGSYMLGGGAGRATGTLGDLLGVSSSSTSTATGDDDESAITGTDVALTAVNPIGGGVNYILKSDKLNLAAVVQASKTDSRAKYLASPVVMTVDNKEATIDATENRQFVTGWTAQSGSYGNSGQPTPNYTSKDIGIKLKVTPKINPNGTVMLKIEEEYSQFVKDGQSMLIPENGLYVAGTVDLAVERKMGADVLLENGQTVVFGGLTETSVSESESGVPILKDIPWIGKWLFGKVVQSEARKELLIFMTPYVLDDAHAAQDEALRRKRVLSDPRPWDDRGWSRSPIADPVSKKEQLRRQALEWANQDAEHDTGKKLEEAKEQRVKDLEEKADKERREWAEKHAKEVLEALKRHEQQDIDWSELIDKLRREQEGKDAAKAQEELSAAKIRESADEPAPAPAPAAAPVPAPAPESPKKSEGSAQPPVPEPAHENLLKDLKKD